MSIAHSIKGDLVELQVLGRFTIDELLAGFRRVLEDEDLPANARLLINVTGSEEVPPMAVVERIASILCEGREKLAPRLAVLVAQSVRYGRARQLGAMLEAGGLAARPFYDRKEALAWLLERDA